MIHRGAGNSKIWSPGTNSKNNLEVCQNNAISTPIIPFRRDVQRIILLPDLKRIGLLPDLKRIRLLPDLKKEQTSSRFKKN